MTADVSDIVTFDGFLTHWAKDRPDRIALREEDRAYSFGEVEQLTAKIVSALFAAGVRKGDRIAWVGKNADLYFLLFFAGKVGDFNAPSSNEVGSEEALAPTTPCVCRAFSAPRRSG